MFLDLHGDTAFTETHGPGEVRRVLREFHAAMGQRIMAHGGTLERFAGDGLMIFFNDPIEIPDASLRAARMACEMQQDMVLLRAIWQLHGYSLDMGIGIARGVATKGGIGFEGRRDYGAIGSVTNLAARLCAEAQGGQILLCPVVAGEIGSAFELRPVGSRQLEGSLRPSPVTSCLAHDRDGRGSQGGVGGRQGLPAAYPMAGC